MSQFKRAAHVDEIPEGTMKAVRIGYDDIVICHTEDGYFAVADECTHDSAPISSGTLNRHGHIICPRHGAKFDCRTGEVKAPPAVVDIDRFELKIEDSEIFVLLD